MLQIQIAGNIRPEEGCYFGHVVKKLVQGETFVEVWNYHWKRSSGTWNILCWYL